MSIFDMLPSRRTEASAWSPLPAAQRDRQKLMATFWDYYAGKHRQHLLVKPGQTNDNIVLNDCYRVIDQSVWFLFGKEVGFEIDSEAERTDDELYLDDVWGRGEQKQQTLQQLGINGGVTGMGVVRLYEPEGGDLPRIQVVDPSLLDIITDANDMDMVYAYTISWHDSTIGRWRRHYIALQENGTWAIDEQVAANGNQWETTQVIPWGYEFAPIVTCQNLSNPNSVWGMSDLVNADLNDYANFVASNINRILKFHAHPKTIGTGFNASALQNTAVEAFWTVPNTEASVFNLEMQSDLASSMEFLRTLRQTFYKVTQTAELDPRELSVGQMSGFALRILYNDPLMKMSSKRNSYGALLADVNERLLVLGGRQPQVVNLVWQDPLPSNSMEQAQVLGMDRQHGLSQRTYLERRGYDAERELERAAEERQGSVGEDILAFLQGR